MIKLNISLHKNKNVLFYKDHFQPKLIKKQ